MRSRNSPPTWLTKARLNNDMYAVTTCGSPVGEGATRSRTGPESGTRDHPVGQTADALDLHSDLVTDLHRTDARRRSGEDDVAGQQSHARRDVGDERRDLVHDLARPAVLLSRPGQRRRDPEVGRVEIGLDPRAERAERVVALRPRPLSVRLLLVARRHVVAAGVTQDHLGRPLRRHVPAEPADDDGELAFVVDALRRRRPGDVVTRTGDSG